MCYVRVIKKKSLQCPANKTALSRLHGIKRGRGVRQRVQASTLVPKNWSEFLRVDLNKKELFYFLAEQVPLVDFGVGKQVLITKGEQVYTSPPLIHPTFLLATMRRQIREYLPM